MASVKDQVARDIATKAIAMIEAHERVCDERSKESDTWRHMIAGKLDDYFNTVNVRLLTLTDQVAKLYGNMWVVAGAIISVLIGAVAFLISNHGL